MQHSDKTMKVKVRTQVNQGEVYHTQSADECHNLNHMSDYREIDRERAEKQLGLRECKVCSGEAKSDKADYTRALAHQISAGEIELEDGSAARCPECDTGDTVFSSCGGINNVRCNNESCDLYRTPIARTKSELITVHGHMHING